ncbi:signal transduction histidine kinase [Streptomyces canus]|nr:signal transduction histidine kinase [Streptomyces canus]
MTLQSAGRFIDHPEASERVVRAVDDLDETIKIIRSTIFGLRARGGVGGAGLRARGGVGGAGLRARAVRIVGEAAPVLGFAPSVRMEGLLDTRVSREIADHVVAVLSEALTNIARHARAGRADVVLTEDSRHVRLTISDDGVGIPSEGRRSGLRNMAERAQQLGGELELSRLPDGGTALVWWVPVPAE